MNAPRVAAGAGAVVLCLALGVIVLRSDGGAPETTAPDEQAGASEGGSATPTDRASPSPERPSARTVLTDVDVAAGLSSDDLRDILARAVPNELEDLIAAPLWRTFARSGIGDDWPIVIGDASLGADGSVDVDMLLTHRSTRPDLVLRLLPAAVALGDTGIEVEVTVDGLPVASTVDHKGARLEVAVPDGRDTSVRIRMSYTVPGRSDVLDDGGPAGYGLLARSPGVVALGHWLPLVTFDSDRGPMQGRGDIGAFPAAVFSMTVLHPGVLVTSGIEEPCSDVPAAGACTWARGVGLRDLSAVLLEDGPAFAEEAEVRVWAPDGVVSGTRVAEAAAEAAGGMAALTDFMGDLAWSQVDVVAVPLRPGAAGMEFPGMVWIDPEVWPRDNAGIGSYVLAHELAHQWFHALVGNGSLSAPVVDESTAQYLSTIIFAERFGEAAAQELAAQQLGGRWQRAIDDGVADDAPAIALQEFSSDRSYGSAVYGRGGQAWVQAEAAVGRDVIRRALIDVVVAFGLRQADVAGLLAVIEGVSVEAADVLRQGWGLAEDG